MTQEFILSVTPVGHDQYLIRTEKVPFGAPFGQEQVTWPVDQWLEEAKQLMGDPLKGLLQGTVASDTGRSALSLIELGQKLYAGLFRDTVRDSWVISQGVAYNRREPLRLRLGLKGPDLPRLPWEVMYGTDVPVEQLRQGSITSAPRPMVAGTRIVFSRYQISSLSSRLIEDGFPELAPHEPLRILMVVSAPTDQEQLKLYREVKHMQQELQTAAPSSNAEPVEIQLTILNQPGREELAHTLEQGRFQVLHYAGHSDLSAAGGNLYLVNNRTGLSEILTGDDLAGLLLNTGIRLAVFNSCRGTHTAAVDPGNCGNRNLAETLVSRGIPAVLAMAEQIPDNVALNLTRWFYRNLKQGSPIDLSLNRARQGLIATYGSHQFYWALPVLYLHWEFDGLLARNLMQTGAVDQHGLLPPNYALPKQPAAPPLEPIERRQPPALRVNPAGQSTTQSERVNSRTNGQALDNQHMPATPLQPEGLKVLDTLDTTEQPAIAQILEQLSPPTGQTAEVSHADPSLVEPDPLADQSAALSNGSEPDLSSATAHYRSGNSNSGSTTSSTTGSTTGPNSNSSSPPRRSNSQTSASKSVRKRSSVNRFWLLPVLGAVTGATVYIGLYGIPTSLPNWQLPDWSTQPSPPALPSPAIDPTASVEELRAIAEESFRQGQNKMNLEQGIEATQLLLDQNELEEASVAISAAPAELKDDASINFLRGRLAWQGMKAADGKHTLEQARDFWERAVAAEPKNLTYQKALMFAYYKAGDARNLEKAIQTWSTANDSPDFIPAENRDFTALAALVLQKRADSKLTQERDDHLQNAVVLYRNVISHDPKRFTSEALQQNWLWTDDAIKDWEALSQVKPDSNSPSPSAPQSPASSPAANPPVSPPSSPSTNPSTSPSPAKPTPAP